MKIRWFPEAAKDLERIYEYYAPKSLRAATVMYNNVFEKVEILKSHPQIAAIEPLLSDLPQSYRSLVVEKKFKVIYYIEDNMVSIARVWDCRQDPEKLRKSLI